MDEYNSARWTNAVKLVTTAVECLATHGLTGCTVPDNLLNDVFSEAIVPHKIRTKSRSPGFFKRKLSKKSDDYYYNDQNGPKTDYDHYLYED